MDRSKCIGGSDIAAIMGLSRYKTPLKLWAEKTGNAEQDDLSNVECVQLGTELENFVAKKFQRMAQKTVRRDSRTFKHPRYEYMVAHIDRRVKGTDELLECKTCSAWKEKEWEGEEIPTEYILQVMWYLGILGMSKGYIAVLIGGQKFRWKEIKFDEELFEQLVSRAKEFWEEFVVKKVPPVAMGDDNELLVKLYPKNDDEQYIQATEEINDMIALLQETKSHVGNLMEQKEECEAKLKQLIGEKSGLVTTKYKVSWLAQRGAPRIMSEQMKEDGVYAKYTEETTKRVLRVSQKKEGSNEPDSKS